jgi:hypothetical protein
MTNDRIEAARLAFIAADPLDVADYDRKRKDLAFLRDAAKYKTATREQRIKLERKWGERAAYFV